MGKSKIPTLQTKGWAPEDSKSAGCWTRRGDRLIELLQILIGGHGRGEGFDVALEVGKQKMMVMKCVHFRERLRGVPMAKGKAIKGHHDAGAIGAEFAMDERLTVRVITQQREK